MPGRFSLRLATVLVLAPAICLCILAYEGALGDSPAPFNDNPSFHDRRVTQNDPLRFCTYLDENHRIQAKAGPCSGPNREHVRNDHSITALSEFCLENKPDDTIKFFKCPDSASSGLQARHEAAANIRADWCIITHPNGSLEVKHCPGYGHFKARGRRHIVLDKICYTARPGGWWEPCSKQEGTKHPRADASSTHDSCLFIESGGEGFLVNDTACVIHEKKDQLCNTCSSMNSNGEIETFECYLQVKKGDFEVVRCNEDTKQPRDGLQHDKGGEKCIFVRPNGEIVFVDCENPGNGQLAERASLSPPGEMCLEIGSGKEMKLIDCPEGSKPRNFLPHEYQSVPPHLLNRATPPAHPIPDQLYENPENWTGTARCTHKFCEWARNDEEVRKRCYGGEPGPVTDEVLKYTAPFECNLCLEDGELHEDKEHIQRHCVETVKKEDLVFKTLLGIAGGVVLIAVIFGIYREHAIRRNLPKKPHLKAEMTKGRFGGRGGGCGDRVFVLPPYDGVGDFAKVSSLFFTRSQEDAREIRSLPSSLASGRHKDRPEIIVTEPNTDVLSPPLVPTSTDAGPNDGAFCQDCENVVVFQQSQCHKCSAPITREPSKCQLVMQPALHRSSGSSES